MSDWRMLTMAWHDFSLKAEIIFNSLDIWCILYKWGRMVSLYASDNFTVFLWNFTTRSLFTNRDVPYDLVNGHSSSYNTVLLLVTEKIE